MRNVLRRLFRRPPPVPEAPEAAAARAELLLTAFPKCC
jgi:hypothetical protein